MPCRPALPTDAASDCTHCHSAAPDRPARTARIFPAVWLGLIAAVWATLPGAPALAGEPAAQLAAAESSTPPTCSAPSRPHTPDVGQTLQALRDQLATQSADPADRPVALNARGYNYGALPDLESQLLRAVAEAQAR